jgi:formiminotetrahydrofolate cyclodeaminase
LTASADRQLAELLGDVAARTPAPGAGCTAAWSGALAAALLEMVAAYTGMEEIVARAAELRAELLAAGEQELHAYDPVLAVRRLPADDPTRAQKLRAALTQASDAPRTIARAAAEVAELAAAVAGDARPDVRGDALAGELLAQAAARAAAVLVETNAAGAA